MCELHLSIYLRAFSPKNAHRLSAATLLLTYFQKFQGLEAMTLVQKPPLVVALFSIFCTFPFSFWSLGSCSLKPLFGLHFGVFNASCCRGSFTCIFIFWTQKGFFVLFQTPFSWCLAVLCLPFGIVSFGGFLPSNVHVLWASNMAPLSNFCAAWKHLALLSALSI